MPTDTPAARKALHAYLSTESHNAWHDTCAGEGVSVSGVLEILGSRLEVLLTDELVREVRRLDAARRRRGPSQSQ